MPTKSPTPTACPYWCEVTARHVTEVLTGEVWHERHVGEHVFIDQYVLSEGETVTNEPRIGVQELPRQELTVDEARRLAADLIEAAAQLEAIEGGGL